MFTQAGPKVATLMDTLGPELTKNRLSQYVNK